MRESLPPELLVRARPSAGALLLAAVLLFAAALATVWVVDPWLLVAMLDLVLDVLVGAVVVLLIAVVALVGLARGFSRSINRHNSEGLHQLALGHHDEALRIFRLVEARQRWLWSVRMVARWNQAMAQLLAGRFDEALQLHADLGRDPWRRQLPYLWEGLPSMVALCYALRGELEPAKAALGEQRRRRVQQHLLSWVLPEAVIALRAGRAEAAVELFEKEHRALETAYAGVLGRVFRTVHAFALAEAGRSEAAAIALRLQPDDVCWMQKWPAIEAWVRGNGLLVDAP